MSLALDPSPTLTELLRRTRARGASTGVGLLDGRGRRGELRSWPAVIDAAELAAGRLAALGVEAGEPLMLALPTGREFLELWLGAVLLGALPVAVAPPAGMGSAELVLRRLATVYERLGGHFVVGATALSEEANGLGLASFADAVRTPEEVLALDPIRFTPANPGPEDVAFLQLTSGSTGVPRAVQISHRGAAHNPRAMIAAIAASDPRLERGIADGTASCASWLPLHHDMGLLGCLFTAIVANADLWLSAPRTFLGRPQTWLRNVGASELVVAPAPNFAYQTCAERLTANDLAGVDLSGWRAALCGAEMIRPETAELFAERFAPLGFAPEAFRPCYGLAEATLAVTFDTNGQGIRTRAVPGQGDARVTCVGTPVLDTAVEVAAPDGTAVPEGQIGEVRVKGPGVFLGYRGDAKETAACLRDGWLSTGDLGFMARGELYLTGRIKEILIVNGQNLMPHELEWIAEGVSGGGGATRAGAFSIDKGSEGERAVIVVETAETDPAALGALTREIKVRLGRTLGISLADCAFVRRGRLPKTTSGKVIRTELRRRYVAGEIDRLTVEEFS